MVECLLMSEVSSINPTTSNSTNAVIYYLITLSIRQLIQPLQLRYLMCK